MERTNWLAVGLLWAGGLLAAGQFAKIALTLEPLGLRYGAGPEAIAPLVSVVGIAGIVFGAIAGGLVARTGLRRALVAGLAVGGALSLVQAVLPPLAVFAGLRLVEGAAHLAIVVAAPALMAGVASARHRPLVMGLWGTFFGVGFALMAELAPWAVAGGGAGRLFLLHGAAMLVLAVAIWPVLPSGLTRREETSGWTGYLAFHRALYARPRLSAPGLGFCLYALVFLAMLTFLAPLMPDVLGAPASTALPLISLTGTFAAGALSRLFNPAWIAAFGFGATAALLIPVVLLGPEVPGLLPVLLFTTLSMVPGASFAMIPALNADPGDQARSAGALAQMGNIGTTSGTPLFALVVGGGAPALAGLALALCAAGTAIVLWAHARVSRDALG